MKIKLLVLGFLLFAVPVRAATLTLTWEDNSGNEDGFKIERRLGNTGAFTEIGQVGVDTTSFVDTTSDDKVYCYQVRATNLAGDSDPSNIACGPKPAAPGVLKITTKTTTTTTTTTTVTVP